MVFRYIKQAIKPVTAITIAALVPGAVIAVHEPKEQPHTHQDPFEVPQPVGRWLNYVSSTTANQVTFIKAL